MPKQSPIPDEVDKPFWDACNEDRLIMQNCTACDRMQYPPEKQCSNCDSGDHLDWREVSGSGKIYGYGVIYDCPIKSLQPDQPFNLAVIQLDEDPGVLLYSHLPGTPLDEVPIGGTVRAIFHTTPGTGQKVCEWEVIG